MYFNFILDILTTKVLHSNDNKHYNIFCVNYLYYIDVTNRGDHNMIFTKPKPKTIIVKQENGTININRNSEVGKQIQMIKLTQEDLIIIKNLQPYVLTNIDYIVNKFYKNLEYENSLLKIINDNSSIERLKTTLKQHIIEMFDGTIDEAFLQKRIKIAHIHVKIGLQTKWYMCAFQDLLLSLINIIEENVEIKEEYFLSIKAVSKLLNLEQQIVLEAYDAETDRLKQEIEEKKLLIQDNVANASQNLAAISEQTNASFQQLNAQSHEMIALSNTGTELSVLAEEQANQGKEQIGKQATNMTNIHKSVDEISNDVKVLGDISKQMEQIVNIVNSIADQTNLLSLNASIEAARAGEYGRGFSIVAGEVRKLSEETKQSVSNVANLISNTHTQVENLTNSLDKIRNEVNNGSDNMKETENHFEQILVTMGETKLQNKKINEELFSFQKTIAELGDSFAEVATSADHLANIMNEVN